MLRYTEVRCKMGGSPFCLVTSNFCSTYPISPFPTPDSIPPSPGPILSPTSSIGVPTNPSPASLLVLRAPPRAGLTVAPDRQTLSSLCGAHDW